MLIDSAPPAMTTSFQPAMICCAASATVCRPDEQKRLTVIAGTVCGNPARSAIIRPIFKPCSPSGIAQPMITSSTSWGFNPSVRFSAAATTVAPISSGRLVRSFPRGALPTALRTPETITASLMGNSFLIPQRLASAQEMPDSLSSFFLTQQRDKCFTFQVEDVLLIDPGWRGQIAAAQNARLFRPDLLIIIRNVVGLSHHINRNPQRGEHPLASGVNNVSAKRRPIALCPHLQDCALCLRDQMIAIHHNAIGRPKEPHLTRFLCARRHLR